jgi:hypothetical protein
MLNRDRSFGDLKKDQMSRESELMNIMGSAEELASLSGREGQLDIKRNEILFNVTTQMEDTRSALREAEGLVERLRKHLNQLEGIHKILTKK